MNKHRNQLAEVIHQAAEHIALADDIETVQKELTNLQMFCEIMLKTDLTKLFE